MEAFTRLRIHAKAERPAPAATQAVSFCQLVSFMCKRFTKDQNVHSIRQIFTMIDLNGDGTIAPDEMEVVLRCE